MEGNRMLFSLLLLFFSFTASAQVEHYISGVAGKEVGVGYTLQYKRWSVETDGGWLTGFKGGVASVNGLYRLFSLNPREKESIKVDAGLGVFAQTYSSPTQHQQELAEKLGYTVPVAGQLVAKVSLESASWSRWSFGVHFRRSLVSKDSNVGRLSFGELCLSYMLISVQYKI
ncbi:MAG: hypothetical protein LBK47_01820 [Prevotellaceae bacterium]|jgi:hypothetical protein|nr:hypothetical protein [Prevotellaceae bacterium]